MQEAKLNVFLIAFNLQTCAPMINQAKQKVIKSEQN